MVWFRGSDNMIIAENILAPKHFEAFCWTYLTHYLKHPIGDFHRELINLIRFRRVAIAAPRGFAKTTYFSVFYPLFRALTTPGVSILITSATATLAETLLLKIRNELENNTMLIEHFGYQNKKGKWASDAIHLDNGSVIMAKGSVKYQIRGDRLDIVIADDLETDELVASKERLIEFNKWFWTTLIGTVKPSGQLICIGTLLHPDSFLSELVTQGRKGWTTRIYRAEVGEGEAVKSLWPEEWPLKKLKEYEMEVGTYAYQQEKMNSPLADEQRTFKEGWFKFFEKEPQGCVYFTTVDPAIDIENPNDYTAIVTCAVDSDKNIYVVETLNKRMLPKETIDAIFDVYHRWSPQTIAIEEVGFQKMLRYEVEEERRRRKVYPVIAPLKSGGRRKDMRIQALQPWFENGKIHIKKSQDILYTQLKRFPGGRHDDVIDALAYMLDIIRPATPDQIKANPHSIGALYRRYKYGTSSDKYWGNNHLRSIR